MRARISSVCEKLQEAVWLAAIIAVPAFFNIYSSRVFEPDKVALMRSLAILILALGLIQLVERIWPGSFGSDKPLQVTTVWANVRRTPLLIPALVYLGVVSLTALTSIAPRISLWGSFDRLQGAYTTFCYVVFFSVLIRRLRRWEQVERLITLAILTSVPISIYGILQHFEWDPLIWSQDVAERLGSNLGNPIFVAAYLSMIAPLTWLRIIQAVSGRTTGGDTARGVAYAVVAVLQVLTVYWSASRGPLLGLIICALFFALVWALLRHRRRLALATVAIGLVAVGLLAALNIPNTFLDPLKTNPYIRRLSRILDVETNIGRILMWQGSIELIKPHAPLEPPTGAADALNSVRPVVGYGPESMVLAFERFYPPKLARFEGRDSSPDRAHNETFDRIISGGFLGLLAYLLLFGAVIYLGLERIGFVPDSHWRSLFFGLFAVGAVVGAGGALLSRPEYMGLGLPLGTILGAGAYLLIVARGTQDVRQVTIDERQALLVTALNGCTGRALC